MYTLPCNTLLLSHSSLEMPCKQQEAQVKCGLSAPQWCDENVQTPSLYGNPTRSSLEPLGHANATAMTSQN